MPQGSLICEPRTAEYEKIRKYVVGQLAKSGDAPMRLASNREIARRFGVTHPTVLKALKDLVDDGFLTVKPGIGTFTNPAKLRMPANVRLIGALSGDGRAVLISRYYWHVATAFVDAILDRSERYQVQHCFLTSAIAGAAKEILGLGLDATIWVFPTQAAVPAIASLEKAGLPVLSIGRRIPGVSSFGFDFEADNYRVTQMMLAEGRRKILLVLPPPGDDIAEPAIKGVEKAFRECGLEFNPGWIMEDADPERSGFGRLLSALKPDGIVFNSSIGPFWSTIKERLEIMHECRLYSGASSIYRDMGYVGYLGVPDLAEEATAAADNLTARIESKGCPERCDGALKMKIVRQGMRGA
jgi:DNA-binding Lrp family transcriptional regulator